MRGGDDWTGGVFSYVRCEAHVPADHRLRPIRAMADEALEGLSPGFEGLCSKIGRPSLPPETLLRALLPRVFHSIGSQRRSMERMDCDLLFRWFVGLSMDAEAWVATRLGQDPRSASGRRGGVQVSGGGGGAGEASGSAVG